MWQHTQLECKMQLNNIIKNGWILNVVLLLKYKCRLINYFAPFNSHSRLRHKQALFIYTHSYDIAAEVEMSETFI